MDVNLPWLTGIVRKASTVTDFPDAEFRLQACADAVESLALVARRMAKAPHSPDDYFFVCAKRFLRLAVAKERRARTECRSDLRATRPPPWPKGPPRKPIVRECADRRRAKAWLRRTLRAAAAWDGEQAAMITASLRAVELAFLGAQK